MSLRQQTTPPCEATFTVVAGRWVRGEIRRALKATAVTYGVDLQLDEDRGFIESLFIVRATGEKAPQFAQAMTDWVGR